MSEPKNEIQKITSDASESQIYESIRAALAEARMRAFNAINSAMVTAYWEIGRESVKMVSHRLGGGEMKYPRLLKKAIPSVSAPHPVGLRERCCQHAWTMLSRI